MIYKRNLAASLGHTYRPSLDSPRAFSLDPITGEIVDTVDLLTLSKPARQQWHTAAARYEAGTRPGTVWVTCLRDRIIYAPKDWRGRRVGQPLPPIDHGRKAMRSEAAKLRMRRLAGLL